MFLTGFNFTDFNLYGSHHTLKSIYFRVSFVLKYILLVEYPYPQHLLMRMRFSEVNAELGF